MSGPKVKTLRTVALPDGGFLVIDDVRCARVRYLDSAFRVIVTARDGAEVEAASWLGGFIPPFSMRSTAEEMERFSRDCTAMNDRARRKAEEWAAELRWIIEEAGGG